MPLQSFEAPAEAEKHDLQLASGHRDTEPEYDWGMNTPDLNRVGAWREGNRLFGHTVLNDRGLMATTMIALKALRDSGAPIRGDVIFTGVVGETGASPVDEYQGLTYEGKGFGSRHLVSHGVCADYALVAETTDSVSHGWPAAHVTSRSAYQASINTHHAPFALTISANIPMRS